MRVDSLSGHARPNVSRGAWSALEAVPQAILVVDGAGLILFGNTRAQRTFGCPQGVLVGTRLQDHLGPESRATLSADLAALLAMPTTQEPPQAHELVGLTGTDERFPIELSLGRFDGEAVPTAVVVVRDLTEHRRDAAQDAAARSEEGQALRRLEALLAHAPAFILAVSPAGSIDFINRTLPQHAMKDVIGSSWLLYFPPAQHSSLRGFLRSVCETGTSQTFEVSTPNAGGAPIVFESHMAPFRVGGQILGVVIVSQDVTDKKRSNAELLASRHLALLGTLAAGVAHEINTPIQFLGDNLQFLRESSGDLLVLLEKLQDLRRAAVAGAPLGQLIAEAVKAEEKADLPYVRENMPPAFEACVDGLSRVATIVRSLKEFAHPPEKEMAPSDLNHTVQSAVTVGTNEYKYVANLETDFGDLPLVTCNAGEISQAVLNIVVNAAHAIGDVVRGTDQKGLITVRTRRDGDSVLITIGDTGRGVPQKFAARIFDPFFTTKEVGKGTGQGLAIAWSAVHDHHGGELTFETEENRGTTFSIRLPIAGRAHVAPIDVSGAPDASGEA